MKRYFTVCLGICLLILLSILFILMPGSSHALAQSITHVAASAPTPDPNQILNQANQEASQTQNILNLINFLVVVATAVIALVIAGLGYLGFSTNSGFKDLEKKWTDRLDNLVNLQVQAQERGSAITKLQDELVALKSKMEEDFAQLQQAMTKRFDDTNTAMIYLSIGNQLSSSNALSQAIEAYKKAQDLLPDDPQINYRFARAYSTIGQYDEAINILEKAINSRNSFPEMYMELGLAYRRRGQNEQDETRSRADFQVATQYLVRATELRPKYEDALSTLGGLYRRLGDYENALKYYTLAYQSAPDLSSYAVGNMASLCWYLNRLDDARKNFEFTREISAKRIAARFPEAHWDYYDHALANLVLGQKVQSMNDYRTAIALTPGSVPFEGVLDNLRMLKKAKNPIDGLDEAIEMIENERDRRQEKS